MARQWSIGSGDLRIVFDSSCGALPQAVYAKTFSGAEERVVDGARSRFSIRDAAGRELRPVLTGEPDVTRPEPDCTRVLLNRLAFAAPDGKILPQLQGYFQYDFFADGTAFCSVFFLVASGADESFSDLELVIAADAGRFDDIRWAFIHRQEQVDGAMIQAFGPERYLPRGQEKNSPEIAPLVSFNGTRENGESLYAEFFVEGGASLDGLRDRNATRVEWKDGSPAVIWNFQTVPASKPKLGMQFRNRWGWVIRTPPRRRHLPPLVMYHYLDNFLHYPAPEELEAMRDSGCDVLVMHENWRFDVQNGGVPFDERRFAALVAAAHERNIRIAVYIRGNEDSVSENACAWFDRYLERDFDGLYIDYGSPTCRVAAADERFPHGQVLFRTHYDLFRRLRERVGRDGLIFSHTGPSFSGVGLTLADGYVSGEGEKGLLVAGRKQHEYFSMAPLCCGTMWTAAFPEYSTEKMVPFLAATGQFPHSALGVQIDSSSLTHPREPGINDRAFRPLWKLWGLFRNERDMAVCSDFNSTGVFPADPECGHYLLTGADGERALYIVANFSAGERTVDVTPRWEKCGFSPAGKVCRFLAPGRESPGEEVIYTRSTLSVTLAGNSCAGFYFGPRDADFTDYRRPYHRPCSSGLEYLACVEAQKDLRREPPRWKKVLFSAALMPPSAFGYEDSLMIDLFDNDSWLVVFEPDGSFRKLAEILTPEGKPLYAGESSQEIDLGKLLPPGRHHAGIFATHCGEPFYSFFKATLSDGEGHACELVYRNDYESDRAFLHFDVIIP
ncbi:MAG: hypothetical protein IJU70_12925 [Lentisphaeria bacterium]|nr:hypothetical protein [Lentisphaeria bacterium]